MTVRQQQMNKYAADVQHLVEMHGCVDKNICVVPGCAGQATNATTKFGLCSVHRRRRKSGAPPPYEPFTGGWALIQAGECSIHKNVQAAATSRTYYRKLLGIEVKSSAGTWLVQQCDTLCCGNPLHYGYVRRTAQEDGVRTLPAEDGRHGTSGGYTNHKCRCRRCRDAWAEYYAARGYGPRYRQGKQK